jgi:hypothetical protein
VADVAAYVMQELAWYEFVDNLNQFILEHEINGRVFLRLTDEKLKDWGMNAGGRRDVLMTLAKATTGYHESSRALKVFQPFDEQIKFDFFAGFCW